LAAVVGAAHRYFESLFGTRMPFGTLTTVFLDNAHT
jgi:hypothetical protein